jgi:hypothetical protein
LLENVSGLIDRQLRLNRRDFFLVERFLFRLENGAAAVQRGALKKQRHTCRVAESVV